MPAKYMNRKKFIADSVLATGAFFFMFQSCKKSTVSGGAGEGANGYSFGTGDIALLNFAYVLSQVQAAFYIELLGSGIITDATEKILFNDILKHEIAQREFLNIALGSNALTGLQLGFTTIDFTNRKGALTAAVYFEDLCVQGLNAIVGSMQSSALLTLIAQIISVQARHGTYIHEILQPGSFTGMSLLDQNSLEIDQKPSVVLVKLGDYLKTKLDSSSIPNLTIKVVPLPLSILTVIDFALRLKLLKLSLYQRALGIQPVPGSVNTLLTQSFVQLSTSEQSSLALMATDEQNHVNFLTTLFNGSIVVPPGPTSLTIDITANQLFADITTNPQTLLLAVQVIEDTSVRYFKGQLARLTGYSNLLTSFVNIHSVEARHSAYVRLIRSSYQVTIKPWILQNGATAIGIYTGATAQVNTANLYNIYLNEDNTAQAQIQIIGINGHKEIDADAASEAFDEVLSHDQVKVILGAFITIGI